MSCSYQIPDIIQVPDFSCKSLFETFSLCYLLFSSQPLDLARDQFNVCCLNGLENFGYVSVKRREVGTIDEQMYI